MRFVLDTHLLIWSMVEPHRLSSTLRDEIDSSANRPCFSVVSIWEIAIKFARGKPDFMIHPNIARAELLRLDYEELAVLGDHVVEVASLPALHADPFDRLLVAQTLVEGLPLWTADRRVAAYHPSIRLV